MSPRRFGRHHLRKFGYRFTEPRVAIFNILNTTNEHLSVDEIYEKIKNQYPGIGRATIYRTLDLLQKLNVVLKFDFGENLSRYELTEEYSNKNHHHHLICKTCNNIYDYFDFIDVEVNLIQKLEKKLSQKFNFEIDNHRIEFYGLCDKCKKNNIKR